MPKYAVAVAALLAMFAPCVASAQSGASGGDAFVRAGDLFDSVSGRMVGPRDLIIRRGRIAEVGVGLAAPDGMPVVDLRGCRVTPGLIDVHTHLLLEEGPGQDLAVIAANDQVRGEVDRVLSGAARARSYLEAGFTSVRDLGNSGHFLDLALKRGIDDGRLAGPTIYGSGPGLAPAGGQMPPMPSDPHGLVEGEYRIIVSPADAHAAVREAVAAGADVIKMYPEATPQRTRLSVEEMQAIVSEAKRHGLPVAAHATSDASVREAGEAGVTSIEHGYEVSDETLRLMASKGVWLIATDPSLEMAMEMTASWAVRPPAEEVRGKLEMFRDRMRRARRAGVRLALGSDLYAPFGAGRGAGARSTLDGYLDAGLTPAQALQTATSAAGELVDGGRIGKLTPESWADLIAMPGDPSTDLSALRDVGVVMQRGRLVVSRSLAACASSDTTGN